MDIRRDDEKANWNVLLFTKMYSQDSGRHSGTTKGWRKTEFLPKVVENRGFDEYTVLQCSHRSLIILNNR